MSPSKSGFAGLSPGSGISSYRSGNGLSMSPGSGVSSTRFEQGIAGSPGSGVSTTRTEQGINSSAGSGISSNATGANNSQPNNGQPHEFGTTYPAGTNLRIQQSLPSRSGGKSLQNVLQSLGYNQGGNQSGQTSAGSEPAYNSQNSQAAPSAQASPSNHHHSNCSTCGAEMEAQVELEVSAESGPSVSEVCLECEGQATSAVGFQGKLQGGGAVAAGVKGGAAVAGRGGVAARAMAQASAQAEVMAQVRANWKPRYSQDVLNHFQQVNAEVDRQRRNSSGITPLIIDLDGDGAIALTSAEDGVSFDIDGDGIKDQVSWSQANGDNTDAWIALDRNGDGTINSGKELFGNQWGQANGFDELARFDDNHDGRIDRQDTVYRHLKTWQDINHDGVSQANEMKSLQEAGVEALYLTYDESAQADAHGNQFRQISRAGFKRSLASALRVSLLQNRSLMEALFGTLVDAWLVKAQK